MSLDGYVRQAAAGMQRISAMRQNRQANVVKILVPTFQPYDTGLSNNLCAEVIDKGSVAGKRKIRELHYCSHWHLALRAIRLSFRSVTRGT